MQPDGNSFFSEMSSRTDLTWHIGMKTAFYTKNMQSKNIWDIYYQDFNFKGEENPH